MIKNKHSIKKIILFITLLILILNSNCLNKKEKPTDQKVEKAVESIKDLEKTKIKNMFFLEDLFSAIGNWLNDRKIIIIISLINTGFILLFLGIFFLVRFIISRKYTAKKVEELKKEFREIKFDNEHLKELLMNHEYSKAILYLHNYSIFYLINNKIAYKKNMTNYDFYNRIKDQNLAAIFKKVYSTSEKIVFDDYKAGFKDYELCYEGFFEVFPLT